MRGGLARRVATAVATAGAMMMIGLPGAVAGGGGGGGGGTTGVPASAFSGEAYVAKADVTLLGHTKTVGPLVHAGPLPAQGGFDHAGLLEVNALVDFSGYRALELDAEVGSAKTAGAGDSSRSAASVAEVSLDVGDLNIRADVLRAHARAKCLSTGPTTAGDSEIASLKIGRRDVLGHVSLLHVITNPAPNTVIKVDGLAKITINEQFKSPGAITVNALHVELNQATFLTGVLSADVVISSAHADVQCPTGPPPPPPPCPVKDFVTGGGYILKNGSKVTFGMVGGEKPNGLSGHFNAIDHGTGQHIKAGTVVSYEVTGPTSRRITYSGEVDGTPATIVVNVADNGEPGGGADTIFVSGGYSAGGTLEHGNIQLHKAGPCEGSSTSTKGGGGGGKGKK